MDIDVVRTRATGENGLAGSTDQCLDRIGETGDRRAIDVTDVTAARVEEYARTAIDHDRVHLEQRGGRTFLVADG
ncbi:hypothetical protein [Halomarina pelagica]|uniref:hypothetical protein n=1 Tax=Halomarina pelagica TaxID=2961599 RepID=UPI0020C276A6|nr:hypothetical protein [Halomarina sp. BND7]